MNNTPPDKRKKQVQVRKKSPSLVKKQEHTIEEQEDNLLWVVIARLYVDYEHGVIYRTTKSSVLLWDKKDIPIVHGYFKCIDGDTVSYLYDLEIDGYREMVSSKDIMNGYFVNMFPSLGNIGAPRNRSMYADVIRKVAESNEAISKDIATSHCGVHFDEATRQYIRLLPNGLQRYVKPDKPHTILHPIPEVKVLTPLWSKRFTYSLPSPEEQEAACNWLREITPQGEAALALVHGIASMQTWIEYDEAVKYALMYVGKPGSGKTSLARIAYSGAYPLSRKYNGDTSFTSTAYAMEMEIDRRKHTPFGIDDMNGASSMRDVKQSLERIVRSLANNQAVRPRGKSDGGLKKNVYVDTNPIMTCEIIPQGIEDSLVQRIIVCDIPKGYINVSGEDGVASMPQVSTHVTSFYHWSDTYDKYMLQWVNNEGLEAVTEKLASKQREIKNALQREIKTRWHSNNDFKQDEAITRFSELASYLVLHARMLDDVTHQCFTFEDIITPLLFELAMKQLEYLGYKTSNNGTPPFLAALVDVLGKIANGEAIDGTHYKVEATKGVTECPLIKIPSSDVLISPNQWGYKQSSGEKHYARHKDAPSLMYVRDNQLILTSSCKAILVNHPALRDICKDVKELGELVEQWGYIEARGTKQRDISFRYQKNKKGDGLAIKLNVVLDTLYQDVIVDEDDTPVRQDEEHNNTTIDDVTSLVDSLDEGA